MVAFPVPNDPCKGHSPKSFQFVFEVLEKFFLDENFDGQYFKASRRSLSFQIQSLEA